MKIGIISDIHGNIHGLKTVLSDLTRVDKIICAGDITGYYPFINEVIEDLKNNNVISVKGNHDQYLINGKAPDDATDIIKTSVNRMKQLISKDNLEFIKSLPASIDITIDNKRVLVFHGSPWNHLEERIYPDYPNFKRFSEIESDVVILGHTHHPFIKNVGKIAVVNSGSCGQPRDYNLLSYILWDTENNIYENKRISWDIEKFKKEARAKGTDEKLFEVFSRVKK